MAAKAETLARQFEAKVQDAVALVESLSETEWTLVTAAEKWPVGVTAHHLAAAFEPVAGIVSALASGQPVGHFTTAMLDEMNARHAQEYAHCTKGETLALLRKGSAAAGAVVRGLSDEQLARTGTVFADVPPMTVEQLIMAALIAHSDEHLGSIRKTVGRV